MSKVYTVAELQRVLDPVFARFGVKRAVLFGSYAKGQAGEGSDVDLLVDSGLRGLAFYGLLDSVASALEVPVDLIDASQIDRGSRIEQEIAGSGVQIYGLRNRIVHGYSGVNMQIVWDTVSEDLPALREEISASLGDTKN